MVDICPFVHLSAEGSFFMYFTDQLEENMAWLNQALHVDKNFDVVYRVLTIADKKACLYFIDGFTKDDSLLKNIAGLFLYQSR